MTAPKQQFGQIIPPLLTCEAVISEAAFLLKSFPRSLDALMDCLHRELIEVTFVLNEEVKAIQTLMSRYQNVPMSLADACLVRMSELHDQSILLTLDSDFQVYRKHGRKVIPLLIPTRY